MRELYESLKTPVVIIAGDQDRLVNSDEQSGRLNRDVAKGRLRRIAGAGHMVHQTAPALVMAALDEAIIQGRPQASKFGPRAA
jgi:pimeloyl-ACP methyl ester carboxylesterase